ncbi:LAFA_0G00826g1_1 [Lachancea sp. 'fantastica']|nr:LAFA_0G00826g1_1 [Lachancea sp. 'fantastica']
MVSTNGVRHRSSRTETDVGLDVDRNKENTLDKRSLDSESTRKPRKKRKTYSCNICRKFKTRCDFEPLLGRCHRCNVLNLSCSLTGDRREEIMGLVEGSSEPQLSTFKSDSHEKDTAPKASSCPQPNVTTFNNRLNKLEANLASLNSKLDLLVMLAQGPKSVAETDLNGNNESNIAQKPHTYLGSRPPSRNGGHHVKLSDQDEQNEEALSTPGSRDYSHSFFTNLHKVDLNGLKLQEPPLKLISDIDERLFPTKAQSKKDKAAKTQRPFVVARTNFLNFFNEHEKMCLYLSRDFLEKSHFWIIPGGVKEIDRAYVEKHLFISSVFAIIAMGFEENGKYEEEQEVMYPLVERLLTNTLTMFERLTDHDIEAILYCSMFNVSRKSKRHRQMKFNSLVLTNFAISSLLNIIDFHKIKERVIVDEEYDALDIYHLRILNSLTACRLQYSIGFGSFLVPDEVLDDFNSLTARFPQANFGDDIKISEINLSEIVNNIFLNFKSYFKRFSDAFAARQERSKQVKDHSKRKNCSLTFPELEHWLKDWDELLSQDGGGVLLFAFNYYYIMICRSFVTEFYEEYENDPLLFGSILETMKTYCFTLLDGFLKLPSSLIKGAPVITVYQLVYACLTLCDFLHYFDASEREQILNLCTKIYWHLHTIGEKLNEATENVGKIIKSLIETGKRKVYDGNDVLAFTHHAGSQGSRSFALPGVHNNQESPQSVMSTTSHASGTESNAAGSFNMPDVDQFSSFEDFFQDFFENLKPTTQNIFSSLRPESR